MERYCPFCGTDIDLKTAPQGQLEGTVYCPVCRQEHDAAHPPSHAAQAHQASYASSGPEPYSGPHAAPHGTTPQPPPPPPVPPYYGGPEAGPASPDANALAWEGEAGFFTRLWRTTWQVLLHPVLTFRARAKHGYGHALSYALIVGTFTMAVHYLYTAWLTPGNLQAQGGVWRLVLLPLALVAGLFIATAIVHLFLWILRGSGGGFEATFRVLGYSVAADLWHLIPYVGTLLSLVWGLVVLVGGLSAAHGTGKGRVVVALLLPLVGISLLVILLLLAAGVGTVIGLLGLQGAQSF